jgi:hypothetical protein
METLSNIKTSLKKNQQYSTMTIVFIHAGQHRKKKELPIIQDYRLAREHFYYHNFKEHKGSE